VPGFFSGQIRIDCIDNGVFTSASVQLTWIDSRLNLPALLQADSGIHLHGASQVDILPLFAITPAFGLGEGAFSFVVLPNASRATLLCTRQQRRLDLAWIASS